MNVITFPAAQICNRIKKQSACAIVPAIVPILLLSMAACDDANKSDDRTDSNAAAATDSVAATATDSESGSEPVMDSDTGTNSHAEAETASESSVASDSNSDSDTPTNIDEDTNGEASLNVGLLAEWSHPEAPHDIVIDTDAREKKMTVSVQASDGGETETLENVSFSCTYTTHDVIENHDAILNLGGDQSKIKPGLILQGDSFKNGVLSTIPLARSPLTLSIALAVDNPNVEVDNPNTASLQQGVSTLQQRVGTLPGDLPAMVNFQMWEVDSVSQMGLEIGAHAAYDNMLADVDFEASFAGSNSQRQYTIVSRLMQPMYTISFADDMIATPSDFFADTVSQKDWNDQVALGNVSTENPPVFISSVTYGRLVVYSATSTLAESATEVRTALEASYRKYEGGVEMSLAQQEMLSSMEIKVLAVGGNATDVVNAIQTGDYSLLFENADATSAVPISYEVKAISGARPTATTASATTYVEEECTPLSQEGRWVEVTISGENTSTGFVHVSVNNHGEAWAVGPNGDVYGCLSCATSADPATWAFSPDGITDARQVSVTDSGIVYMVDSSGSHSSNTVGEVWRRELSGDWSQNVDTSSNGVWAIDAAGDDRYAWVACSNGELWYEEQWDEVANYQNVSASGEDDYYQISMANNDILWFIRGSGGYDSPDTGVLRVSLTGSMYEGMSNSGSGDPAISLLAAATTSEIYALKADNTVSQNAIMIYAFGADDHGTHPGQFVDADVDWLGPGVPRFLEAGPNEDVWVIDQQGTVYRYIPPPQ